MNFQTFEGLKAFLSNFENIFLQVVQVLKWNLINILKHYTQAKWLKNPSNYTKLLNFNNIWNISAGWLYVINVTLLQTPHTIIAIHLFWHFTTAFLKKKLCLVLFRYMFFIDPWIVSGAWKIELVVFTFVWTKITGHLWGNNWGPPHN